MPVPYLRYVLTTVALVVVTSPCWPDFARGAIMGHDVRINGALNANLGSDRLTPVQPGDSIQLDLFLELDAVAGEVASVAEAQFHYENAAVVSTIEADFDVLASDWSLGAFGTASPAGFQVSLTSENEGGRRRIGVLRFVAEEPGTFSIGIVDFLASADLDVPPFFEVLSVERLSGQALGPGSIVAGFRIVPEPSTFLLLAVGFVALGHRRRSKRWTPRPYTSGTGKPSAIGSFFSK